MAKTAGKTYRLKINDLLVSKEISLSINGQSDLLEIASRQREKSFEVTNQELNCSLSFYIDPTDSELAGLTTFLSLWKSGGSATFEVGTFVTGEVKISFSGLIPAFNATATHDNYLSFGWEIKATGEIAIEVAGAYQAESTNIDEISVYSANTGAVSYTLRNDTTGTTTSGTLTFVAPAESGAFEDGLYKQTITGLTSGTLYTLTAGFSTSIDVITQFNIPGADQELLSIAEADYLTKTGINQYGLPYIQEPIAIDGTVHDFSGNGNHGAIKNSPAASVLVDATLTFSNTSHYTRPTTVTIGGGTATASGYNSGTGVLTIDGAGTVEYLVVDGVNVYLCANVGNFFKWTQNSISYGITFSAVTWTTTNNNSFLQAKGGTKTLNIANNKASLPIASGVSLGRYFTLEVNIKIYPAYYFGTQGGRVFRFIGSGLNLIQIANQTTISYRGSGGTDNFTLINCANQFLENQDLFISTQVRDDAGTDRLTITVINDNGTFTDTFDLINTIGEIITLTNFCPADATTYFGSWGGITFKDSTEVITNQWNPSIGLSAIVGPIDLTSRDVRNGYLPTTLDTSGNSTGTDVQGNPLPTGYGKRFFDFGESIERKATTVDQTFADAPPPIVSDTDYGIEDTTQATDSKWGLTQFVSGAGGTVDAEMDKLLLLANNPAPKIIKRV